MLKIKKTLTINGKYTSKKTNRKAFKLCVEVNFKCNKRSIMNNSKFKLQRQKILNN